MKVDKIKIPFKPQEFEKVSTPSEEDISYMENLAKQDKLDELYDFINKKTIGSELSRDLAPGMATKQYLHNALSSLVTKQHPELANMDMIQKMDFLKNKIYPDLDEYRQKSGLPKLKLSAIPWDGNYYDKKSGELNVDTGERESERDAIIMHELGHSVDHLFKEQAKRENYINHLNRIAFFKKDYPSHPESRDHYLFQDAQAGRKILNEYIKKLPKLQKIADNAREKTTPQEVNNYSPVVGRTPNFEDYNWKSGDFESDTMGNPLDKYKDIGDDHHLGRPFALDNFINFAKGGLKDVVKNEDRFKNLRKKLA